ncbi:MAG: hypothetical protein IT458_13120 [Planctomycetes bacterium]|nr:hypothetical protein [Planctomycetota bacterium]
MHQPSAELQAGFLRNLQRVLTEGDFDNTYKFALLLALTRWAVENPDHDPRQPLDVAALAPHFVELYWPHLRPFGGPDASVRELPPNYGRTAPMDWHGILVQHRHRASQQQIPRVLKRLRATQASGRARLRDLAPRERAGLLRDVRRSIAGMPLWRLQKVRDAERPLDFLYTRGGSEFELVFAEGAAACLALFAPLIEDMVRAAWLRFVLRCNPAVLGAAAQVEEFLFPGSRASLQVWRPLLGDLQDDRCFYCAEPLRGRVAVDHFLPWSRYMRDLGPNFVLAHDKCNGEKRDRLASIEHLEHWCSHNATHSGVLGERFARANLPYDWPTLRRVAGSLYRIAEASGALVWRRANDLVALDPRWRTLLGFAS